MKIKRVVVNFKGKKIPIKVKNLSLLGMGFGLMFKSRNTDNLLFNRRGKWGIHSFFVFFPFLALWLDEKNKVIEYKIIKPFCSYIVPKQKFAKLIEIPVNNKNKFIINRFSSVKRNI